MFGSLMGGDFDDDPFFGHHMRSMRQMNNMMSSMFGDPFGAFDAMNALTGGFPQQNHQHVGFGGSLMPFGFPAMPNMNRLLGVGGDGMDGASFCSSSVISMSHGPDGRPQVYQATSSTKTGPGGLRETQKTVQDSRSGVKKMAIGHHIGERGHIIEREQNLRSGQQEERQDFINLEEEQAEDFNREFTQKSRQGMRLSNAITDVTGQNGSRRQLPAIMAAGDNSASSTATSHTEEVQPEITMPPSPPPTSTTAAAAAVNGAQHVRRGQRNEKHNRYSKNHSTASNNLASPRRPIRTPTSSPLTMSSGLNNFLSPRTSIHPHPYNVSPQSRRNHSRQMRDHRTQQHIHQQPQPQHHVQIEEIEDDYEEATPSTARH